MVKLELQDGHVWHLRQGRYRAYGLSLVTMDGATEINFDAAIKLLYRGYASCSA